jgi:hypothetical protein
LSPAPFGFLLDLLFGLKTEVIQHIRLKVWAHFGLGDVAAWKAVVLQSEYIMVASKCRLG